jgi:guanine deaminase
MYRLRTRALWAESNDRLQWLPDAVVCWGADGAISSVAPWSGEIVDEDARDGLLTPGFVDAHVHYPQTRIIGAASGPLLDWLARSTFPEEQRFADPTHAAAVAARFVGSLARAGTTLAMAYSSVHATAADALFSAADSAGLRLIAGPVLMDDGGPPALMCPADEALPALSDLVDRWHGHAGRLHVAVIPRFGLSCTASMMARAGRLARDRGLWVSTHLSENPAECEATRAKFGAADYLEVYERADLIHDRAVLAHCIHLSADEWARLRDARAVIAHCPDSNDFLGSGGMDVAAALAGSPVALGTDVAAGRTFRVPRVCSAAHDNALRQGHRVPPVAWLWHATAGGAAALGQPSLSRLTAGTPADLALHDPPPWLIDPEDLLGWLLFCHDTGPVRATWVAGREVWRRPAGPPAW